jgi:hypothetical protein
MPKEFTIWCDESIKKGKYYSNFYGGVLVSSTHINEVTEKLNKVIAKEKMIEEIKWQKVNTFHLERYKKIMDVFFRLIKQNKIKLRIMFTQNANVAKNLQTHHVENEYFLLYYQFFKHSFGLRYSNPTKKNTIHLRAYFDYLPDTLAKRQQFKEYIKGLESTREFNQAKICIKKQDIAEIDSKERLLLQLLDVVLGSMSFRLNDMHKEKPIGKKRRGKRTIAKEKLYKHINTHIRSIKKGFNIGISTGTDDIEDRWNHPYRHWKFVPSEFEIDEAMYK